MYSKRHLALALSVGLALGIGAARALRVSHHGPKSHARHMDRLARKLELTSSQREQIEKIFQESKARMDEQRFAVRGKIREVLDERQREKFDRMMERRDKRLGDTFRGPASSNERKGPAAKAAPGDQRR